MKTEIQANRHPKQSPSQFVFTLAKIAVAQICGSAGFKAAQTSALDALTDIAARYLEELAKSSAASANFSGRTECNVLDVILAIEGLCSEQGFPGASNYITDLSLYASSTIKDIIKFVDYSSEIPFAKPLPHDCLKNNRKELFLLRPRSFEGGNSGGSNHIPKWLPPIPKRPFADEEKEKEKEKEKKWEFGWSCGGYGEKKEELKGTRQLPVKRGRVKFKLGVGLSEDVGAFGVDMRKGVCSGGKRVVCQSWIGEEEDKRTLML